MDVPADGVHSAQPAAEPKTPHAKTDTAGEPINEKRADDVACKFKECVEYEHAGIVALIGEH